MHGQQRADLRQHAITTVRTALGDWWRTHLGQSWWELLADPGTRADALWQAASVVVLAVEPILGVAAADDPHTGQLQRERDYFAGQVDALRSQIERLLTECQAGMGAPAAALAEGQPASPKPAPGKALVKR